MATEFARSQSIGLSRVGAMLGRYQKHTIKPTNTAELKTALPARSGRPANVAVRLCFGPSITTFSVHSDNVISERSQA